MQCHIGREPVLLARAEVTGVREHPEPVGRAERQHGPEQSGVGRRVEVRPPAGEHGAAQGARIRKQPQPLLLRHEQQESSRQGVEFVQEGFVIAGDGAERAGEGRQDLCIVRLRLPRVDGEPQEQQLPAALGAVGGHGEVGMRVEVTRADHAVRPPGRCIRGGVRHDQELSPEQ